ncbi:UNKNOWN [Stylonychia lemnae]|uniref:Uncharacterized protein n=1 Tax=Stylonychia lemnae TaxID=5949 RepID=A0A078AND7_STYLE|nr:UNKNOWN [Stylonychia lemnae]|eukprot:CDW82458.1 UNKNOWN [Stylonychia lemnae]
MDSSYFMLYKDIGKVYRSSFGRLKVFSKQPSPKNQAQQSMDKDIKSYTNSDFFNRRNSQIENATKTSTNFFSGMSNIKQNIDIRAINSNQTHRKVQSNGNLDWVQESKSSFVLKIPKQQDQEFPDYGQLQNIQNSQASPQSMYRSQGVRDCDSGYNFFQAVLTTPKYNAQENQPQQTPNLLNQKNLLPKQRKDEDVDEPSEFFRLTNSFKKPYSHTRILKDHNRRKAQEKDFRQTDSTFYLHQSQNFRATYIRAGQQKQLRTMEQHLAQYGHLAEESTQVGLFLLMIINDDGNDPSKKKKIQKMINEVKIQYEQQIQYLTETFTEETEQLYQIISDQSRDSLQLLARFNQLDFLYQNVKGDYEILIQGIKTELRNEQQNAQRCIDQFNDKQKEIDFLKEQGQEKDQQLEIARGYKANFKVKTNKLKEVIRLYQKKYHDIDIKFMHEEINRLGMIKDTAKHTIHEFEIQSKLYQQDIKQLLDYIAIMITSGFQIFHSTREANEMDEIDEAPTLLGMLQSSAAIYHVTSRKNIFKVKKLAQYSGQFAKNPNKQDEPLITGTDDKESLQSFTNSAKEHGSTNQLRRPSSKQIKRSDLSQNEKLDDPFGENLQIDYDNDKSRFREDFENYLVKKGNYQILR